SVIASCDCGVSTSVAACCRYSPGTSGFRFFSAWSSVPRSTMSCHDSRSPEPGATSAPGVYCQSSSPIRSMTSCSQASSPVWDDMSDDLLDGLLSILEGDLAGHQQRDELVAGGGKSEVLSLCRERPFPQSRSSTVQASADLWPCDGRVQIR